MKLYELTNNYLTIQDLIEQADDKETLLDTLQAIEDTVEGKIENIIKMMRGFEAEAEAIKTEETRLAEKRRKLENKASSLKEYMEWNLQNLGLKEVKAGMFKARFQKNPPTVEIADEEALPDVFKIPQPNKVDRKGLIGFLKEGNELSGVRLIQKESLRIK
jgi:predicted nuclease with TOPRIM domain